jgi:hypothetical protein
VRFRPLPPAGAALVLVLSGCGSGGATVRPGVPFQAANLIVHGRDRVALDGGSDGRRLTLSAEGETGADRLVWWPTGSRETADQGACLTWERWSDPFFQPGVALRVTTTHAVTVTRGVYNDDFARVNIHTWDLSQLPDDRATLVASVPLPALAGTGPYRMCAEAIGAMVRFRVWSPGGPEPGWGDPGAGTAVEVPVGWRGEGHAGWYSGHLQTDASVTYADLTTEDLS